MKKRTFTVTLSRRGARAARQWGDLFNTDPAVVIAFFADFQIQHTDEYRDEEGWHVFYGRRLAQFRKDRKREAAK